MTSAPVASALVSRAPLSRRARTMLGEPNPLHQAHGTAVADAFDPVTNPGGYVNLGTAENHLLEDLLLPALSAPRRVTAADTHYGPLHGTAELREAVAGFLGDRFGVALDPGHLVLASGSSAVLDLLAYGLCDEGEAIVVPTPYYAGFDVDFTARARVELVPAPLSSGDGFRLTPDLLRYAVEQARGAGRTVRAVLLASPNNPLGHVYDAALVDAAVALTAELGLQLIVDEVYANSVFGDREFTSALGRPEEHVHVVWGFAKDFGLSGYKVGVLHSRHPEVLAAARAQAYLSPASNDVQRTLVGLLSDEAWVARFVAENLGRLRASRAHLAAAFAGAGVPTLPAEAGLFVWADLRAYLPEPTVEGERALWRRLFDEARVNLGPGWAFHAAEPGWFRATHSVDAESVTEAARRLATVLKAAP